MAAPGKVLADPNTPSSYSLLGRTGAPGEQVGTGNSRVNPGVTPLSYVGVFRFRRPDLAHEREQMPKCQHCNKSIDGREIKYRKPTGGSRRARSIRLCRHCADRYDALSAARRLRLMVLAMIVVTGLLIYAIVYR
jgi:hypothetical protein